ncbi:MAG TPA: CotS family spore coat protein [Bacillota bacterium]|nr:CotS family spore coat protein [Bacillota bacterium]
MAVQQPHGDGCGGGLKGILANYPFRVEKIVPVKKVYRLVTDVGPKALKRVTYPTGNLLFMYSVMEHLWARGFNRLARINLTSSGSPMVQRGEDKYFVSDWIEGREAAYTSEWDVAATAKCLTEIHQISRGFNLMPGSNLKSELGRWPENFYRRSEHLMEFIQETKDKKEKTKFDAIFLKHWERYYEEALAAQEQLVKSPYHLLVQQASQLPSLCHHDIAHHNVIMRDGQAHLIDFDYCLCDLRIHDVASLIIRVLKKNDWRISRGEKALKNYNRCSPLSQNELRVILPFIMFPQDFWQVAWTYYREDIGRSEKESLSRMRKVVKSNKLRREFIKEFTRWT